MNCNEFQLKVTVAMTVQWSINDEIIVEPYGTNYKVEGSGTLTTYPTIVIPSRRSRWCLKTQPYRYDHLCNRFWIENLPDFNRETIQYAKITYTDSPPVYEKMDARFFGPFGSILGMPYGPEPWNKEDPFYPKAKTVWDNKKYGPLNSNAFPGMEVNVDNQSSSGYYVFGTFNGYKTGATMSARNGGTTASMNLTIIDTFPS